MMTHEPDDARAKKAVDEVGPNLSVLPRIYHLANVVQQGRSPESAVGGCSTRELEHLKGMVESVAFWVKACALAYVRQRKEQVEQVGMHGWDGAIGGK